MDPGETLKMRPKMNGRVHTGQRDEVLWQVGVANFSEGAALAWKENFYAFRSADVVDIEGERDGARP